MTKRVAVIGMGQMGSGMAGRLSETGFDVLGYDIDPVRRRELGERQVAMAETLKVALAGRKAIVTSLPDPAAARAAWLGDAGIIALAEPGSLIIEVSTIDPGTMRAIGAAAEARGLAVVDCPVSGGPGEARAGTMVLIVGGSEADIARAKPILDQLGPTARTTGPVGTAKAVKLVNNLMALGNVLVASEAFALGLAAGVDADKLYDVLSVSGARSFHFTKRFPNALKGNYEPGFKMELGEKDLALAIDMGRAFHQPTPAASLIRELMALALAQGYRGKDFVALFDMYKRMGQAGGLGKKD